MRRRVTSRAARGERTALVAGGLLVVMLLIGSRADGDGPTTPGQPTPPAAAGELGEVVDPVPGGRLTSGFGSRWGRGHYGVDVAAAQGTPIRAIAAGTVTEAGPASGFGLWVHVTHDDGTRSVYGHMHRITTRIGAQVAAGEQIATVGSRGQSTGPHLHLEIWPDGRRDRRTDPADWFAGRGAQLVT